MQSDTHDVVEIDPAEQKLSEVSVQDALSLAVQLHRVGHLDQAESLYKRILEAAPDQPDALHFLGILSHAQGHSEEAIELINRSIRLDPSEADRHNNLGNVLVEVGRLSEAAEAYRKAIVLKPGHANAFNNLGTVFKAQRQAREARAAYEKAIELDPNQADAHNNLGNLLSSQGRVREAMAYYCKAITLCPHHPEARRLLGIAFYTLGELEEASAVYRQWLEDEPDHPVAKHLLAACSGNDIPARASDAYIETSFDTFAQSFDAKLERLSYRAPALVAEALVRIDIAPAKRLVAVDAGCGTGLCGPLIAPYVSRLTGVDLSSRMLAEAKRRDVYDELAKAELTAYLAGHSDAFDLIVSADTLVYFGPLDEVFAAASRSLRVGGLLIFTVEAVSAKVSSKGYRINPHGRYSHSRPYLRRTLRAAGMTVQGIDAATLRKEGGKPVAGLVVTASKSGENKKAQSGDVVDIGTDV